MNFGKKKQKDTTHPSRRQTPPLHCRCGRVTAIPVPMCLALRSESQRLHGISGLVKPGTTTARARKTRIWNNCKILFSRFGNLVTGGRPTTGHMQWHQCAAGLNVHAQLLCKT